MPPTIDKYAKAASILQEAAKISSGGPSSAPPGLEGLGESSTGVGDDEQPGLKEDVAKLTPPPAGKGRKVLRPQELRGLPEDITVERLTEDIEEDFKTFNSANPQFLPNPEIAWHYFKDIHKRYGLPIEDSDWTGNPEDIGLKKSGSQPEKTLSGQRTGTQKKTGGKGAARTRQTRSAGTPGTATPTGSGTITRTRVDGRGINRDLLGKNFLGQRG